MKQLFIVLQFNAEFPARTEESALRSLIFLAALTRILYGPIRRDKFAQTVRWIGRWVYIASEVFLRSVVTVDDMSNTEVRHG